MNEAQSSTGPSSNHCRSNGRRRIWERLKRKRYRSLPFSPDMKFSQCLETVARIHSQISIRFFDPELHASERRVQFPLQPMWPCRHQFTQTSIWRRRENKQKLGPVNNSENNVRWKLKSKLLWIRDDLGSCIFYLAGTAEWESNELLIRDRK
jgi:hypothetical protein